MSNVVLVQTENFDLDKEYDRLITKNSTCGAVVLFCGLVRDFIPPQQLVSLELEHYPLMTESMLGQLVMQASARWAYPARIVLMPLKLLNSSWINSKPVPLFGKKKP